MSHLSLFAIALACCLAVNPTVAHAGSLEEDSATGDAVEATAELEGAFEAGAVAGDATEEAAVQEDASAKGPIAEGAIEEGSPAGGPARVRDTRDSRYDFNFQFKGASQGTEWRGKDSYSSTYLRVDYRTGKSPHLFVDGANNSKGAGWRNCTNGDYVRAPGVGQYEIHNGVRELGYAFARLTGWADQGSGKLSGLWSPDCAGNYTDLNR